jgi:hypothetical protein
MLNFIKKIFGGKPTEAEAPYKVETPVVPMVEEKPVVSVVEEKPAPKAKKPVAKKATTRKPKAPKA